ncbi:MAG TPA: hypothetical protein VH374_21315 [Polyangia bacterium]|jgi:hypothetical protein|nr:hypothetical protein [Polyangia bacterium]
MHRLTHTPSHDSANKSGDRRTAQAASRSGAVALRLTVAREIVSSMPTLTLSGQQFAMQKFVALFDDDVRGHVVAVLGRDSAVASAWVEKVRHEARRTTLDAEAFRRTAEALIARLFVAA